MPKLRLTIATGDYDLIRPLKEGLVEAGGIELIFLTDMGPRERHWRLARKTEWQELPQGTFVGSGQRILATDEGEYPLLQCRLIDFAVS